MHTSCRALPVWGQWLKHLHPQTPTSNIDIRTTITNLTTLTMSTITSTSTTTIEAWPFPGGSLTWKHIRKCPENCLVKPCEALWSLIRLIKPYTTWCVLIETMLSILLNSDTVSIHDWPVAPLREFPCRHLTTPEYHNRGAFTFALKFDVQVCTSIVRERQQNDVMRRSKRRKNC